MAEVLTAAIAVAIVRDAPLLVTVGDVRARATADVQRQVTAADIPPQVTGAAGALLPAAVAAIQRRAAMAVAPRTAVARPTVVGHRMAGVAGTDLAHPSGLVD